MAPDLAKICFGQSEPPPFQLFTDVGDSVFSRTAAEQFDLDSSGSTGESRWVVIDIKRAEPDYSVRLAGLFISQLRQGVTLVFQDSPQEPCRAQLRALGCQDRGLYGGSRIYRYALDESNPGREWNTPEHWAHPERFDKR